MARQRIESDPRLRAVAWRDLTLLSRGEIAWELSISLPWLGASLVLGGEGLLLPALLCSFMFFLTGLRQSHNAQHYALGLSRPATEWALFALSGVMLGSMHAVQFNHLRHHRYCLGEQDVEGESARMPGWKVLLLGPLFPVRTHRAALRMGSARMRRWVSVELAMNVIVVAAACAPGASAALRYHVVVMIVAQCCSAFFAVWSVHHGCDPHGIHSRTTRSRLVSRLAYGMFYHLEHHLFPAVPTTHLGELARRIDRVAPELAHVDVFGSIAEKRRDEAPRASLVPMLAEVDPLPRAEQERAVADRDRQ
jgi:fatty acid desaturase